MSTAGNYCKTSSRKVMKAQTMEVELMKLDTRPDGDKNVRVLGPGDWGDGGAININLIHSLIDSSNIHITCPVLCALR